MSLGTRLGSLEEHARPLSRSIMLRLDFMKLYSSILITLGLLFITQLFTSVSCQINQSQISFASALLEQQKPHLFAEKYITTSTEHSTSSSQVNNKATIQPLSGNGLEANTRKVPETYLEDTTNDYKLSDNEEPFIGSLVESSDHTANPMIDSARDWLQNEENVSVPAVDINQITMRAIPTLAGSVKNRRQADNYLDSGDWWTKLAPKQSSQGKTSFQLQPEGKGSKDQQGRNSLNDGRSRKKIQNDSEFGKSETRKVGQKSENAKPVIYKEQPLNQNSIMTLRYQLQVIKNQHRALVTKSMRQLQQLDNKLVESYKQCFKRKMPLYGGMLYRTRDFIVRMAKDVNHEKKVLEAMTKQVQKVLKQKMSNKTIVREYNQLLINSGDLINLTPSSVTTDSYEIQIQKSSSRARKEDAQEVSDHDTTNQSKTLLQQQINKRATSPSKSITSDPLAHDSAGVKSSSDGQERELDTTTRKPTRATKYIVSVNEVNLKKELNRIQALIDRVNGSCYELTSVVDDINYLFRLTSDYSNRKGSFFNTKMNKYNKIYGSQKANEITTTTTTATTATSTTYPSSNEQQKRMKKTLRSPIRVFLERYGKLTMLDPTLDVNSSGFGENEPMTAEPSELKPIYDAASLRYSEPDGVEMGFGSNMNESPRSTALSQ